MSRPHVSTERVLRAGRTARAPRLSVLTPFDRRDPSTLLARLSPAPAGVEFVLLNDGAASPMPRDELTAAAEGLGAPTRLIVWAESRGRAAARNRLIAEARADYVLFLDADTLPESPAFLSIWLGIMATQRPTAAFGGASLAHVAPRRETALHHGLFSRSDGQRARLRARARAPFTVATNLLVRKDFLALCPFDETLAALGFADADWALSAMRHTEILHIDNPASRAGLEDVDTLLRGCAEMGPGFGALARKHAARVGAVAPLRATRVLRGLPARKSLQRMFGWVARDPLGAAPMPLRRAAFDLYRASCYAEHLE